MDNAGFLSFATFAWITPMMWAAFRRRLDWNGLRLSPFDESDVNTTRSDFILVILIAHICRVTAVGGGNPPVDGSDWDSLGSAGSRSCGKKRWQRWAWRRPRWFE